MAESASPDSRTMVSPRAEPTRQSSAAESNLRGFRVRPAADGAGDRLPDDAPRWLLRALAERKLPAGRRAHRLLTERDLPSEEDEDEKVSVHTVHDGLSRGLCTGLESRYRGRGDVFVAHDLFVYFEGADSAARLSPDLFVSFDAPKRARGSYVTWREGKPPDFVLEILSESTWRKDIDVKPGLYERMGVREYFLFDPHGHVRPLLWAWRFAGGRRERLPLVEVADGMRGAYSELLGLHLCHTVPWRLHHEEHPQAGRLRWHDPAIGRFLETARDSERRADVEGRRADAEGRRADAAGRRADAEGRRADAEERRADSAERRANAEAAARRAIESRVAELEARLERR